METGLILNGHNHTLELKGKWQIKTYTKRVISKAKNPRRKTFYVEYFKGRASMVNLNHAGRFPFNFTTEKVSFAENVNLEQKVLFIDGLTAKNHIVDKKLLIDFLCELIFTTSLERPRLTDDGKIKRFEFCFDKVLKKDDLIKAGILTDNKLQIKLSL